MDVAAIGEVMVEGTFLAFAAAMVLLWLATVRYARLDALGRWVTPASAFALVVALLTCAHAIVVERAREVARMRSQLVPMAEVFRAEAEHLGHERLQTTGGEMPGSVGAIARERILDAQRRWLRSTDAVSDVYTVRREGSPGNWVYRLVVDSETDYNRNGKIDEDREEASESGEYLELEGAEPAFEGETVFDTKPTRDRWGYWVSSHAPLRNARGEVEAVIGVDYPASQWLAVLRAADGEVYARSGLTVAAFLLALALMAVSRGRSKSVIAAMSGERQQLAEELSLSGKIERGLLPRSTSGERCFEVAFGPRTEPIEDHFDRLVLSDGREILVHASGLSRGLGPVVLGTITRELVSSGGRVDADQLGRIVFELDSQFKKDAVLRSVASLTVYLLDPLKGTASIFPNGRAGGVDGGTNSSSVPPSDSHVHLLVTGLSREEAARDVAFDGGEALAPGDAFALPPGDCLLVLSTMLHQAIRSQGGPDGVERIRNFSRQRWTSARALATACREALPDADAIQGTFLIVRRADQPHARSTTAERAH